MMSECNYWMCFCGYAQGGEFREGGAIQGLVFFRSRDWRFNPILFSHVSCIPVEKDLRIETSWI